jgi:hypothetical protein
MGRWRAGTVWLAMWATDGFFFHPDSTVFSVFLILQVGLDPLQLVLMGTILEVSYLLFEIVCAWDIGVRRTPLSPIRHSTRCTPFVLLANEATRSCRSGGRYPSRNAVPLSTRTESDGAPRLRGSLASAARSRPSASTSSRSAAEGGIARHTKPSHRPSSRRFFQAHSPAVARPTGRKLHDPAIASDVLLHRATRPVPEARRSEPMRWMFRFQASRVAAK